MLTKWPAKACLWRGSEAFRVAQFDLYRLTGGQLVVDLQTDLIGIDASRVVAPLREAGRYAAFPGLTPVVEFGGATWIVRVQELAAVPGAELREPVGTLTHHRDGLKRALDILIDGV